jgi:predicted Zn-dependent peptidase
VTFSRYALVLWLSLMTAVACTGTRAPLPPPAAPQPHAPEELATWRAPPPLLPEADLHVEWSIQRARLETGLGLNVISRPTDRTTAIALWVPTAAGSSEGAVAGMVEALRAGTRTTGGATLINPQLARETVSVRTSESGSVLSWEVLPRFTRRALELLSDFVARPVFDAEQTRLVLAQQVAVVRLNSGTSLHVGNLARDALPGIDIASPEQDARRLLELTPEMLRRLHGCVMLPEGAELIVVGPAATEELMGWSQLAFSTFITPSIGGEDCGPRKRADAAVRSPTPEQLELQLIYGGSIDPWLVMVVPGPALASEDYLPFGILARVLERRRSGAGRLRHMGATYGIHARVDDSFPGRTLLELEGQVAPESAQRALRTLLQDMRGLAETIEVTELDRVKRRWRNGFINSLASNVTLAELTLRELRRGRGAESLATWPDEIMTVSLERCREVARTWLSGAQPSIAVAGAPVQIARGLGFAANVRRLYWTEQLLEPKKGL